MSNYALIGNPLGHSWSKRYYEEEVFVREGRTDCRYTLHAVPTVEGLREWVEREGIDGFNVTVPHKRAVVPLLDRLSLEAAAIGAVNCVTVRGGVLTGYNTDAPAFRETLEPLLRPADREAVAVVLGTGGAARAVAYALGQLGIDYRLVSRTPRVPHSIGYGELRRMEFGLVVNATPVGMYPNVDESPWPWPELLDGRHLVYDLIYNPMETRLLCEAAARGARTAGGYAMLRRQADLSWAKFK